MLISEDLGGVTESELCSAIRFAQANRKKDDRQFNKKPDIETLEIWVKWYRKHRKEERTGTMSERSQDGFLAMLKSKMLNAKSHMDRWNILCQPTHYCNAQRDTTYEECCLLENWLEEKYQDWRRPTRRELDEQYKREHGIEKATVISIPVDTDDTNPFEDEPLPF